MGSVQAYSSDRDIRVGIWANQRNILVSADTDYQIVNADNHKILEHLSANEKATIVFNASGFTLNGKRIDAVRLSILKLKNDNEHSIEINKKQYFMIISIYYLIFILPMARLE